MSKIRMGVLGCGAMGNAACKWIGQSDLMDLEAVADIREEAARECAREQGIKKAYSTGDALINDDEVEAVVIAMPACHRTELAIKSFKAGKHVMLEKPVAMNAGEVEAMIEARGDLKACCFSSRYRYFESAKAATEFCAGDSLGELRMIRVRGIKPDPGPPEKTPPAWRLKKSLNGGGVLSNWGCYDLDYVLGITGWTLEPEIVLANVWNLPPELETRGAPDSDAEHHASALIKCRGGSLISFERGEFMPAGREMAWQIVGSRGTLDLSMMPSKGKQLIFHEAFADRPAESRVLWEGDEEGGTGSIKALEDFARGILGNKKPENVAGLEESLIIQKITDGIYESAETGKVAEIKIN